VTDGLADRNAVGFRAIRCAVKLIFSFHMFTHTAVYVHMQLYASSENGKHARKARSAREFRKGKKRFKQV